MWSAEKLCTRAECYAFFLEAKAEEGREEAKFIAAQARKLLPKATRALDVPCGTGRVSIPLAKHGFDVTGVDAAKYYIGIARRKAKKDKLTGKTRFILGKMQMIRRVLAGYGKFDIIANVYTSIGYGTKQEDVRLFRDLRALTNKGGLFFISTLANKGGRTSAPWKSMNRADRFVVLDEGRFDKRTSHAISRWRFYDDRGAMMKLLYSQVLDLRLYSAPELKKMLEGTGWKVVAVLNAKKENEPLTEQDRNFNVIAKAV